jgi:hypothetical protein
VGEFQFKSGVKTLEVKNSDGAVIKTYSINVGQKDQVKAWIDQLGKIQEIDPNVKDSSVIDKLFDMEKEVVTLILGDWETLWNACEQNVFSMLSFVKYLSEFLTDAMQGFYKDYV